MTIRILVNGSRGRMGQIAVQAVRQQPEFLLVAETSREHHLADEIKKTKADIVIDLTNADSALKNTHTIIEAGARPVIGTSGLTKENITLLQKRCEELKRGGIIVPNFSLGAVLMMKHAQEMAKYFSHVEIIEMHHDKKLDSPSGTAIKSAEMLASNLNTSNAKTTSPSKETIPGARGASYQDIQIHAIRLPGLMAHQQIIFGETGETLTIRHDTLDRRCFMPGIILACQKVIELNHLIYGLEFIL